jgi:hypothetical protein
VPASWPGAGERGGIFLCRSSPAIVPGCAGSQQLFACEEKIVDIDFESGAWRRFAVGLHMLSAGTAPVRQHRKVRQQV